MFPDQEYAPARGSFQHPVLPPSTDPRDSPTKSVEINCQWLPYIRGALQQLVLQATWVPTDVGFTDIQMRAMTLISLFDECDESILPIACPYDWESALSELGWTVFCDVPHGCIGVFSGSAFESTSVGDFNQLQIISPTVAAPLVTSATFTYTSAQPVQVQWGTWDGSTLNLINGTILGPSGTGVSITLPMHDAVPDKLRFVFSNYPADSGHDALIQVSIGQVILDNASGECPS